MEQSVKDRLNGLKEKVRKSNNLLIVGIDIGKARHCTSFLKSDGDVLRRKFILNDRDSGK